MKRSIVILALVALSAATAATAATAAAQAPALDTTKNQAPASLAAPPPAPPQFTELQALKLELNLTRAQNLQQQFQLMQGQARQLDAEREALVLAIEKEHPGWVIDRQTLQFKKPDPPAPKDPLAPKK